ncbi:MAG TPA: 2Fe-2S iron-sulfur cluster-binding protein [Steroidobacter sp.]|uniref:2Fe-2S iron-sulfur cluster-binding protein n=1 Tax=Steroidobacter sp. TaxID=1978227 RepID=UPI002ED827A7
MSTGGLIDRTRTIRFKFNERSFTGHPGDTLASALIANGVDVIGSSFKYHRPRGFYGAGVEDPNAMLGVQDAYGYEPALRAGQVRLAEGMESWSVTGWPSAAFDVGAVAQLVSRLLSAGFYYKTFKWPSWAYFEPWIRRATGFGRPQPHNETRAVHHRYATCDVLIVGGGPAGLATARALMGRGLRVIQADDQPQLGGSLNWETAAISGLPGAGWAASIAQELAADPQMSVLTCTTVVAAYENNHFVLVEVGTNDRGVHTEYLWKVHAQQVVLATGVIERPLLFPDNDRPGIMLSNAVRRMIGEFGVAPARRMVIHTNNDSGYLTALAAHRVGIDVAAVVDTRSEGAALHAKLAREAGIRCLFDTQIQATAGYRRLSRLTVRSGRSVTTIACDGLAVSGGFSPSVHLACHRGSRPIYESSCGAFVPGELPEGWYAVGGVNGTLDLSETFSEAATTARAILDGRGVSRRAAAIPRVDALAMGWGAASARNGRRWFSRMWVDFQNDVKASDIELAAREGYVSIEHLKRYTTLGMGTDQGRTSNVTGLALMAELTQRTIGELGTTTFRPPYTAVRLGTIANARRGDLFKPRRFLPAHAIHQHLGAVFEDFGWERPDWYRSNAPERESAVALEMASVRNQVGVFDASSLGKIEITGPDAAKFLSRLYVSNLVTLKPGRVRYSVMLKEDGVIFDDGVVSCLSDHHFLASPTSGNAEAVAAWFERWRQTEWPTMRVAISPVTSNWASIAIAGPRARELLTRLKPDFDISNAAFPHMQIRVGTVAGVLARVARISFTGELQFEISVQARYAAWLLSCALAAEGDVKPRPVGLEAWLRLRLEKGYLHVGSDTNGRTTPIDVGMGDIVAKRQDDFIGKRSLRLQFATSPQREQLVGLRALDGTLKVGGRILSSGCTKVPCPTEGYVTSACFSPSVGASIALALLERGHAREGEMVNVYCDSALVSCRISNPTFYDPTNQRLQA